MTNWDQPHRWTAIGKVKPALRLRLGELIRICSEDGIDIMVYCGLRSMKEQAVIFRQSRTKAEIDAKKQSLTDRGFPMLASAIDAVGPQTGIIGRHTTKSAPGESWHQYGLAADCVPLVNGKPMWDEGQDSWEIYKEAASIVGLSWAGGWKHYKEIAHVQVPEIRNPLTHHKTPEAVNAALAKDIRGELKCH